MQPTQPPTIQEPVRYEIKDDKEPKPDRLDPSLTTPIHDTIKPYGYEDTKEYSWR